MLPKLLSSAPCSLVVFASCSWLPGGFGPHSPGSLKPLTGSHLLLKVNWNRTCPFFHQEEGVIQYPLKFSKIRLDSLKIFFIVLTCIFPCWSCIWGWDSGCGWAIHGLWYVVMRCLTEGWSSWRWCLDIYRCTRGRIHLLHINHFLHMNVSCTSHCCCRFLFRRRRRVRGCRLSLASTTCEWNISQIDTSGHHAPHLRQSATLSAILTGSPTVVLTVHIQDLLLCNILCKIVRLHHPRSLGGTVMQRNWRSFLIEWQMRSIVAFTIYS